MQASRSFIRRVSLLFITAAVILACVATSLARGSTVATPAQPTLQIAMTSAVPTTLDPALEANNASLDLSQNVFNGLVQIGPSDKVLPDIASSWTISSNGLVYTFQLRKNVDFQDGTPLTSADFVYSLNRSLSPKTAAPLGFYLADIKGASAVLGGKTTTASGIVAVSPYELRITLAQPQGDFLQVLSRPVAWVVEKTVITKYGASWVNPPHLIGTGPYELSSQIGDTEFIFTANPHYFRGAPAIKRIEVTVLTNSAAAVARYQAGEFDVVDSLSSSSLAQARKNSTLRTEVGSTTTSRTDWIGMRIDVPPFNKLDVRLALQHAINKATVVELGMGGEATPAKSWIPQGIGGNIDATWSGYAYNVGLAQKLFAAAGYPGGKGFPTINLYYTTDFQGLPSQTFEVVQQELKQNLGINMVLHNMPVQALTALMEKASTRPLMWAWSFGADIPDATTLTEFFGLTGGSYNWEGYSNKTYDALIEKATATLSISARTKVFERAELLRMEDSPDIPLYYPTQSWLVKPDVNGYGMTSDGVNMLKFIHFSFKSGSA